MGKIWADDSDFQILWNSPKGGGVYTPGRGGDVEMCVYIYYTG